MEKGLTSRLMCMLPGSQTYGRSSLRSSITSLYRLMHERMTRNESSAVSTMTIPLLMSQSSTPTYSIGRLYLLQKPCWQRINIPLWQLFSHWASVTQGRASVSQSVTLSRWNSSFTRVGSPSSSPSLWFHTNRATPSSMARTVSKTIQGICMISLMDKFHLIHETNCVSVQRILASRYIFTSRKTQQMADLISGQGGGNRRLADDPRVSLTDSQFFDKYDEVDGVYFRLYPRLHRVTHIYSDCIMVFSHRVLQDFDFVMNTEENFGFFIDEEGVAGTSQFSGEPGMSVSDYRNLELVFDQMTNYDSTEVLVRDDVPVGYLRYVIFKHAPQDGLVKLLERNRVEYFVV
ncbi:ORF32 [Betabaculovirus altermyunipunctae]|uniref:ORF32 n=1 Tax=Betabaculovirus altermyunipunctae TaxID=3051996 RepID=A0A1S5YDW7_9BBAC|nr:ORF32 [Betabaculovirus altermyunipunctae]AQQ80299.1 ORF32 [Betabaculovirus altermyunipunctae]